MFRVIDSRDTGKTKALLKECSETGGLFICRHPENVFDKCLSYGIDSSKIIPCNYRNYAKYLSMNDNIYIDELELFINYLFKDKRFMGYSMTKEGK